MSETKELQDELSAAADALHEVVAAMGVRALLAKPETTRKAYELLKDGQRTDKQIEAIAANAFERAVTVLAKLGYPGASVTPERLQARQDGIRCDECGGNGEFCVDRLNSDGAHQQDIVPCRAYLHASSSSAGRALSICAIGSITADLAAARGEVERLKTAGAWKPEEVWREEVADEVAERIAAFVEDEAEARREEGFSYRAVSELATEIRAHAWKKGTP